MLGLTGKRPDHLGVRQGRLAPCPESPNCVCSQAPREDRRHFVEPLVIPVGESSPIKRLAEIVEAMPRARVVTSQKHYLHAEFRSRLMGFVDDVEFYASPGEPVAHVRSASRLGYSDLGVNGDRVETIREAFE